MASRSAIGRRPDQVQLARVGTITNGQLCFPTRTNAHMVKALCMNASAAQSTTALYELAVQALETHPEYIHMKRTSDGVVRFDMVCRLLENQDGQVRDIVQKQDLDIQQHTAEVMTTGMIGARMVTTLMRLLAENLQRREALEGYREDTLTDGTLPVMMSTFRQSLRNQQKLAHHILLWICKSFSSSGGFSRPGEDARQSTNQQRIQQALVRYEAALTTDYTPENTDPPYLFVSLSRKANETRNIYLHEAALAAPPQTHAELQAAIRNKFRFSHRDTIDGIFHIDDDGLSKPIRNDQDVERLVKQDGPQINVSVRHTYGGSLDGQPVNTRAPTYLPDPNGNVHGFPAGQLFFHRTEVEQQEIRQLVLRLSEHDSYQPDHRPSQDLQAQAKGLAFGQQLGFFQDVVFAQMDEYQALRDLPAMDDDEYQSLRRSESKYSDMRQVTGSLNAKLAGPENSPSRIATGLPQDRERNPGLTWRDHQRSALLFMLDKEEEQGGGIIGDSPGLGKTALMVGNIIASEQYHDRPGSVPISKPTLVVVPSQLVRKTVRELHLHLGQGWNVFRYGYYEQACSVTGVQKIKVGFDAQSEPFRGYRNQSPRRSVIVVSGEKLSAAWNAHKNGDLHGMFDRILVDEGHSLRYCAQTKRGSLLLSIHARYRWIFTGTVLVNSPTDYLGYATFLANDAYHAAQDRNEDAYGDEYREAMATYAEWADAGGLLPDPISARQRLQGQQGADWKPLPDPYMRFTKRTLDHFTEDDLTEIRNTKNFPASLYFHRDARRVRQPSISEDHRVYVTPIPDHVASDSQKDASKAKKDAAQAPFNGRRIFDNPNLQDRNNIQWVTADAQNYWVVSHARRARLHPDSEHLDLVIQRVTLTHQQVALARDHTDVYINDDGVEATITPELQPMRVTRVDLRMQPDEQLAYLRVNHQIDNDVKIDLENTAEEGGSSQFLATPEQFVQDLWSRQLEDSGDENTASPYQEPRRSAYMWRTLVSTHPAFWHFRYRDHWQWVEYRKKSLAFVVREMQELDACDIKIREPTNKFGSYLDVLQAFLFGSPIYRQMLKDVFVATNDASKEGKNHVLLYTQYSKEADWANKVLGWCGFRTLLITSEIRPDVRDDLIEKQFNQAHDHPVVMIVPFTLRVMGLNLQGRCCTVLCLNQPYNEAILRQCIDRVRRIGQAVPQECFRYLVHRTYMVVKEQKLRDKTAALARISIPGLRSRDGQVENAQGVACRLLGATR